MFRWRKMERKKVKNLEGLEIPCLDNKIRGEGFGRELERLNG